MFTDKCNLSTKDHSYDIPKPLLAEVKDLLPYSADIVKLLEKHGVLSDDQYMGTYSLEACGS